MGNRVWKIEKETFRLEKSLFNMNQLTANSQ